MAPPRHRARGFSRRIQYSLFFGYVTAIVGVAIGLLMVLVARFDPVAFQGIRGFALDLTAPASSALGPVARGGHAVGEELGDYLNAASQNAQLRAELAGTRRQLVQARMLASENARLRRLAGLIEQGTRPVVVARIVGSDLAGTRRYATLAAGSDEGVRPGQPVRTADGLVGRVADVGRHAARIVLLSDGGSAVPLRVVRTGAAALAEGRGNGELDVRLTVAGAPPLRRGDLVVTSGTGGVFPADLPVAAVTGTSGEIAAARALADPATLDFAVVLPLAAAPPPVLLPQGRTR